jgi:selenocysteine-specific elongation factor
MTSTCELVLGTAGHIDHGKTALVKALTGIDTDRLPAEKLRGISIELGYAALKIGHQCFSLVDVPGHERFIRNMVAGATGIDVALLVIAADDGVMPQTREHLEILKLLGVRSGVVVLTKCDKATPSGEPSYGKTSQLLSLAPFLSLRRSLKRSRQPAQELSG